MSTIKTDYTALDEALLHRIADGPVGFTELQAGEVQRNAEALRHTERQGQAWRVIDRRLQALRMSRQRRDPVRLSTNQVLTIEVAHIQTLDELVRDGSPQALWDWVANVYTWSRVAELMQLGTEDMCQQLELCALLLARFRRTQRAGFTGSEYQLAKHGVDVMDELARQVPQPVAIAAARWSEERLAHLRAGLDTERKVA